MRVLEWMIGLPAIRFLGSEDGSRGEARILIETIATVTGCPACGTIAKMKARDEVEFVDLSVFGRCARLVWRKRRWMCPDDDCAMGSWTEVDDRIAAPRQVLTARAARWATIQVGKSARSVNEVANELGCDWHTVNDTVVSYGEALLEADVDRFDKVTALGLDEVLMVRIGPFRRQEYSTQIVDVRVGQLLDVVPGRSSIEPMAWLASRGQEFRDAIEFGTLDLSGPYRKVFESMTPQATLVADPFHVCKLANTKLDECRRRVQNETLGHRGQKSDPLYRCRRLLTKAMERLDDKGHEKLMGLLRAGDPRGEVATCWQAKGGRSGALRPRRRRGGPRVGDRTRPGPPGQRLPDRGPLTRPNVPPVEEGDRRLAHRPRHERTHRSRQQLDQAGQACRLRVHVVPELPDPFTALRREAQLDPRYAPADPVTRPR
jgi:transposase